MDQRLFKRYFSICATMILMSITVLGIIFLVFASQYFKEDKMNILEKNANYAADMTLLRCTLKGDGSYEIVDKNQLVSNWIPLAKAMDADIYLANMSGTTLMCTHRSACSHKVFQIPEEALQAVREKGVYKEVGKMGEIYKSSYYTVGVPLLVEENKIAGIIFASTSAAELTNFLGEILKMFLISALVVMIVAFIVIYFVTSNLVKPLRSMVAATESFAKGDFTVRVPVNEQDRKSVV